MNFSGKINNCKIKFKIKQEKQKYIRKESYPNKEKMSTFKKI